MDIGVSTACFYPLETEKAVVEVKKTGAWCTEVFLEANCETDPEFCKKLKEIIVKAGLKVVSVHGFVASYEPFLFSEYERRAEDARKDFEKVMKAGKILGAEFNSFHGGRIEANRENFNFKKYGKRFDELCEIAGENDMMIAWENVSWCQSADVDFLKTSLEYITSKNFGFTLDLKQATRAGYKYSEYLEVYKNRLLNVHISDKNDMADCLLPGDGNRDFIAVYKDLRNIEYEGNLIIEVYQDAFQSTDEIQKSVEFLRKTMKNEEK